jgi:class 3 adenylate cyclase
VAVTTTAAPDFWDRLAARTKPSGWLTVLESPHSVVRLVTASLAVSLVFTVGSSVALFAAGETSSGWSSIGLAAALLVAWAWFLTTGSVLVTALIGTVAAVVNQVVTHVLLGGYAHSGALLMWGITLAVVAGLSLGRRLTLALVAVYVVVAIVMGLLEPTLQAGRDAPKTSLVATMFTVVMTGSLLVIMPVIIYLLSALSFERARAERLLLSMLPEEVAAEMKETGHAAARRCGSISVLFADAVGFTARSERIPPDQVVTELDEVFTYFDELTEKYGCEKIRTIGDAYMVAAGVPVPTDDHAQVLTTMGLEILQYCRDRGMSFRVGISSGPAVAGVIGRSKPQYDVWGDTVNTASRMESHGEPGRLHVSEATYRLIADEFTCVARGPIEVKGKGLVDTWFVEAAIPDA